MTYAKRLIAGSFAAVLATTAHAVPIADEMETAAARSTLDGAAFSASAVTFTLYADTDDVGPNACADEAVPARVATVQFDGGSAFSITAPEIGLYAFDGGFGMWGGDDANLLDVRGSPGPDLAVATALTAVAYGYPQWRAAPAILTDDGVLVFDSLENVPGTNAAVVGLRVPLPAANWMLIAGLGSLPLLGRRKA